MIASVDELADVTGAWVVKAAWTSAGRDRCRGEGPPTLEQRTRISRLLDMFGPLVFEPWMQRELDVGACARVNADGSVTAEPPHGLRTDARGGFLGIELAPPALEPSERDRLGEIVEVAGRALFAADYTGPYALDAFVYRDHAGRAGSTRCARSTRATASAGSRTRSGDGSAPRASASTRPHRRRPS